MYIGVVLPVEMQIVTGFHTYICVCFLQVFALKIVSVLEVNSMISMCVCVCVCVCVQHLFALEAHGDLVKCIMEAAAAYVGIAIRQRKEPITYEQFLTNRMGKYRSGWLL